jgi:hypothetical protein
MNSNTSWDLINRTVEIYHGLLRYRDSLVRGILHEYVTSHRKTILTSLVSFVRVKVQTVANKH